MGIVRAAAQLDVALQLASEASRLKAARLVGEGAPLASIEAMLADVGQAARVAHAELDDASVVLHDVRRGIAALADAADAARATPALLPQSGFTDALESTRQVRARMSELVAGAEASRAGAGHQWLLEATAPEAGAARVEAARDLTIIGELDALEGARAFVLRIDATDRRSVELANAALRSGPEPAGGMLLDDLRASAASGRPIDTSELGMAFEAAGLGAHAPTWIGNDLGARTLDHVQLASIDLARRGLDPDGIASRVRDLLRRPPDSLQLAEQLELAALAQLPDASTTHLHTSLLKHADALGNVLRRDADPYARRRPSDTAGELAQMRTWLQRAELERDPTITAQALHAEVRAILTKPDADVTSDDIARLALLDEMTGDKALHLPRSRYAMRALADNGYSGTNIPTAAELRHLRTWLQRTDLERDPATTAQMLHDELRAILAKPDADITQDDIARLALLDEITGDKALNLPEARMHPMRYLADNGYTTENSYAATELRQLRTWLERADLQRDPTSTRQTLHDELRAILAKPDADITGDDVARLALLDELTGDKALHLPHPRVYDLRSLADQGYSGTANSAVSTQLRHLRTWLQRTDLERDPTITALALNGEARAILAKPDADITSDDIARLALLNEVTGEKALNLPKARVYSMRALADQGLAGTSDYATSELAHLRGWAYANSSEGLDELARRLRDGQTVDLSSIVAVTGRLDELAARRVTIPQLIDQFVATTHRSADTDAGPELQLMRQLLRRMQPDPAFAQLHDETLELLERNLDRIGGRLSDGYNTYPDMAEVGRIIENAELLGRVHAGGAPSVPTRAAGGADTVTW